MTLVTLPPTNLSRSEPEFPRSPTLPSPRGPITERLLDHLVGPPHELASWPDPPDDPLTGDDSGLALYLCYELHYQGLPGVDEAWEWEPTLLRERQRLERALEDRLAEVIGPAPLGVSPAATVMALRDLAGADGGPSLSTHVEERGTLTELRELAIHRSAYQLKEADPHTWGIPRLTGGSKAALVDIQYGEYGDGQPQRMHATLFATTMRDLGLDDRYGAYLDRLPGITLTTTNVISMFGLHRRRRGALLGHLALFEMCSVVPMGRYARAFRRLGLPERAIAFYDEHVIADERHQHVAIEDLVCGLLRLEPELGGDIIHGARTLAAVEAAFADQVLDAWARGTTSLRPAGPPAFEQTDDGEHQSGSSPLSATPRQRAFGAFQGPITPSARTGAGRRVG